MVKIALDRRDAGLFLMAVGVIGYFSLVDRVFELAILSLLAFVLGFILLLK